MSNVGFWTSFRKERSTVACAALARYTLIGNQQLSQKDTPRWPEPAADHKLAEGDCAPSKVKIGKNFVSHFAWCLLNSDQRLSRKVPTGHWPQASRRQLRPISSGNWPKARFGPQTVRVISCVIIVSDCRSSVSKVKKIVISRFCYARRFWANFFHRCSLARHRICRKVFQIVLCVLVLFRFFSFLNLRTRSFFQSFLNYQSNPGGEETQLKSALSVLK